jgi:signal transduction histidine kinase
MKILGLRFSLGVSRPESARLTLLLAVVVLAPSVALLWFMTQAMRNERLAARQALTEAWRVHLTLAQERLETHWRQTATNLAFHGETLSAPLFFSRAVGMGWADSVILLSPSNTILYPNSASSPFPARRSEEWLRAESQEQSNAREAAQSYLALATRETNADLAAQACQSGARCLLSAGETNAALDLLLGPLASPKLKAGRDAQGRLAAPAALLMALDLLSANESNRMEFAASNLAARLNDYSEPSLSAAQRRFMMNQLQRRFPSRALVPTLGAENLAAMVAESDSFRVRPAEALTPGPFGVWQWFLAGGQIAALYRTESLSARLRELAITSNLPPQLTLVVTPPGKDPEQSLLSAPAGVMLPGWRVSLVLKDAAALDAAGSVRIAAYLWTGLAMVAAILLLGILTLSLVRRQVAQTRLRNDLVANVTHELKTPLASMRLLIDTLLNGDKVRDPAAREYLELVARENARLTRLIDHFLAFSRMERNKQAFDFAPAPPAAIVENAVAAVRERFSVPGCRLAVEVAPNLPLISADADALVTALVNLLDNAFKYSGDPKELRLEAKSATNEVLLSVADNGIGIPARETRRIFKRFYQVNHPAGQTGNGVGLGLSIVKFIVTAHRGAIDVESQPGRGSCFTIRLPAENA